MPAPRPEASETGDLRQMRQERDERLKKRASGWAADDLVCSKAYFEVEEGGLKSLSERLHAEFEEGGNAARSAEREVNSLIDEAKKRQNSLDRRAISLREPKRVQDRASDEAIKERASARMSELCADSKVQYQASGSMEDGKLMINYVLAWAVIKKDQHDLMEKRLDALSSQTQSAPFAPVQDALKWAVEGTAAHMRNLFGGTTVQNPVGGTAVQNPVGRAARDNQPSVSSAGTRVRPQLAGSTAGLPYRPAGTPGTMKRK
ncbi:hypothetical protein [Streptomyces sp. NPDC006012]|uniref:hypothetical protein n=1 Tax=Streptomyces sp. NPDC006012 TaxID=3364739 RepID=UPI0036AFEFEA